MLDAIRVFLLFSAVCFFTVPLSAQSIQADTAIAHQRFFAFSPGWAYQQGRDEGMSSLIYSGHHFNGAIGVEKTKNNQFNNFKLEAMLGRMRPGTQPPGLRSVAQALRVQLDYSHLRKVQSWPNNGLELWIGGSWNNMLNVLNHQRYLNNSLNYAFSSSLGVAARVHYPLQLGNKAFRLYGQLELPLVAFNFRPSYASSIPEGFIAQERSNVRAFFDSGKLQTLNQFFRVRNELGVVHQLVNGNQVFLAYRWDYYSIAHEHRVQMAVHQIQLGWRYQF